MEPNFQSAPRENPSSPTWENPEKPRNDGTDLWKSTLSGQPLVTKTATTSQWHKPQNPTDYKNWGEEDDSPAVFGAVGGASSTNGLGSVGSNREGSIWNSSQPMQNNSSNFIILYLYGKNDVLIVQKDFRRLLLNSHLQFSGQSKPSNSGWSGDRPKEQNFSDSPTSPVDGPNWNQAVGPRHPSNWGPQAQQVQKS